MATSKAKTIDDIEDFKEMLEVMTALEISSGGLKTLDEMKSRVKSELEQLPNIPSWTAGQAFSVLSKIKEQDAKVKEFLLSFYHEVETCYDDLDDKIKTLLQKKMGDVKEKMKNHQIKMKQEDYCLLVAGETGSGKSSLINLILGEELLPYSILSTTSTICELKYGEERRIVAHYKDKDPETLLPTKTFNLVEPKASGKSYHDQIFPFVQSGREIGSVYKKVELFWPHKLLKNGVVIIDSPGVGESEIMDEIVREYLPEAFAFIYVINCTNAGGVQKDRLGKLLEGVKEKRKEEECTSTCALFVCHKWDQVKEKKEEKKVENHVIEKLKNFYPDIVPEKQVVQMSTKNASIAQNYGIVTKRFVSLMNCMRSMVLRSVKARLEFYWRKLKHPNVVTFHGTSLLKEDGETRVILVMEYCKENLKNRIFSNPERAPAKSKNIDAKIDACQWIKQIVTALSFIHDQKVVHRDLKLDNILLSATNEVKITDVGVSKDVNKITGTLAGTPVYVAPEVFHSQLYDTKADIYSLGIILWEMWYGQQAFSEFSDIPSHVALFNMVDEGLRPKHVKGCNEPPRRWKDLMESCWNKKPAERPSASHCLKEAIELHREAMEVL